MKYGSGASGFSGVRLHAGTGYQRAGVVGAPLFNPVFVNGSANASASNSVAVTAPASIVAGNILVAVAYSGSGTTSSLTAPSGFTANGTGHSSTAGFMGLFVKLATGSEPGSYTFSGGSFMCAAILQISGSSTTLDGAAAFSPTSGSPTACTAPSVTPSLTNDLWIVAYGSLNGNTFTTPTGMSAGPHAAQAGDDSIYTFYENLSTTSPTGTAASTQSSGSAYVSMAALAK